MTNAEREVAMKAFEEYCIKYLGAAGRFLDIESGRMFWLAALEWKEKQDDRK